jgi:hypothetical protein
MTAAPRPAPGDQSTAEDHDAWCWREAARLRREHRGWVIIWLSPAHEFRAYGRLPGARRDTALSAGTPTLLATLIKQVEQAAGKTATHPEDDPE